MTKADVLREALIMLDAAGAAGLTMRGLAERLGVRANALYTYTPSKLDLIDDVLDEVLVAVESPRPDDDPAAALRRIMRSTYDVLNAHRHLVPLYVQQQGARGENAQRLGDIMITVLEGSGISGTLAVEARRVLIVYTIGSAAYHAGTPLTADADASSSSPGGEECESFLKGLDWLISGIGV